jgi:hypothetical protein
VLRQHMMSVGFLSGETGRACNDFAVYFELHVNGNYVTFEMGLEKVAFLAVVAGVVFLTSVDLKIIEVKNS